jgi:parallel beta-helix repeat protein
MNDNAPFERFVADQFAREGRGKPADTVHDDILSRARQTRQRPQWLALIKEPPMRLSASLAVGSPTARVAAIVVASLLLALAVAGAGVAGSRLLASDGTIVVDQAGNGTVTTITEAVAMASDGDTILVKPGTYVESIIIGKDITLRGDGPREEVVIEAIDSPAFLLDDTRSTLSTMTIRGEPSRVLIRAGAPVLEDLALDEVGVFSEVPDTAALVIDEASQAVIRDSVFAVSTMWILGGSSPTFEDNELVGSAMAIGDEGSEPMIARNRFAESTCSGDIPVFWVHDGASPTLVDNSIGDCGGMGIEVDASASAIIRGNTIRATGRGIVVQAGAEATIEDNELIDNDSGIEVVGPATLDGNTIVDNTVGLRLRLGATPVLSGNRICDNGKNVSLGPGVDMPDTIGNDICPDAPAELTE